MSSIESKVAEAEKNLTGRLSKNELMSYFSSSDERFSIAAELAKSDKQPQGWRATWTLGHCSSDNDTRLTEHIPGFIEALGIVERDGHRRELLRLLYRNPVPDDYAGTLFDNALSIWESINLSPGLRYYAFITILRFVNKYPELKDENAHMTSDRYCETLSPGIRNGVRKKVKEWFGNM